MKPKKIPKFKNYEEEANFWDTHSIADYLSEMKVVSLKDRARLDKDETLAIRVTPDLKKRVESMAAEFNISTSSLVRMWMVEKLKTL